jgi:hypothetical protein
VFRVNYLPPEQMPSHQRDFPREEQLAHLPASDGSRGLAFLVVFYLLAMLGGIVLLGQLTAETVPVTSASAGARI